MKTCTMCGEQKPKDMFRKYAGRSSDGLRPICKECQRVYEKEYRKKNKIARMVSRQKRSAEDKIYRQIYNSNHRGEILVKEVRRRCLRKGIPFNLDQYISKIEKRVQKKKCEMSGMELCLNNSRMDWNSPSIDRIIPSKGYLYENIRIVCLLMNVAMGKWGENPTRKVMTAWLKEK